MVNVELVKFKYPEVVLGHYRYMGAVENRNYLRHGGRTKYQFVLDSRWGTTRSPIRVFAFFIACTEVNAYLGMKFFLNTDETFMDF